MCVSLAKSWPEISGGRRNVAGVNRYQVHHVMYRKARLRGGKRVGVRWLTDVSQNQAEHHAKWIIWLHLLTAKWSILIGCDACEVHCV